MITNLILISLCIALAAICNAIMDTLIHHWYISIFKKYNWEYWNPDLSWRNKYNLKTPTLGKRKILGGLVDYPVALTDAWHLFKSIMVVLLITAISIAWINPINITNSKFVDFIIILICGGTIWIQVFNLFYNKLLKK